MRKSKILSIKGHEFLNFLISNKIFILLTILLLLGICFGALFIDKRIPFIYDYARNRFTQLFFLKSFDSNFLIITFSSLFASLIFLVLIFLGGTSFVGILFAPSVFLLKAISYGCVAAYIYATYGLKGIALNALVFIPYNLISFIGLLFATNEAILFSYDLARIAMPRGYTVSLFSSFKSYCKKFAVALLLIIFSALTDAFCSSVFIRFFNI